MVDQLVLRKAHQLINQDGVDNRKPPPPAGPRHATLQASKYKLVVTRTRRHGPAAVSFTWLTQADKHTHYSPTFLTHLLELFDDGGLHQVLLGYTEYKREGHIFRCHPTYRGSEISSQRPWYDYAWITWEDEAAAQVGSSPSGSLDDESSLSSTSSDASAPRLQLPVVNDAGVVVENATLVPAQLRTFIETDDGHLYAVVHSCHAEKKAQSVLTNRWQLEYTDQPFVNHIDLVDNADDSDDEASAGFHQVEVQYRPTDSMVNAIPIYCKVDVDTIDSHVLMVPYHKESQFLMEVIDEATWASRFLSDSDILT